MRLFSVPLMEDESLTSFTSRFAWANARTAMEFCQDFRFSFRSVVAGNDDAITILSELSGIERELLNAAAVKRSGKKTVLVGGHPTPFKYHVRGAIKFCAACFSADNAREEIRPGMRRYMRKLWYSRFIRTCPVHNKSLVTAGSHGSADLVHDLCLALDDLRHEIGLASRSSEPQPFTKFEEYVRSRLGGGKPGNDLLDPVPLFVAGDICELVGFVALHGKQVMPKHMSERDRWLAGGKGYELFENGREGLHRFLSDLHGATDTRRALNGGYQLFGQFYKTLANSRLDPAYETVKEDIRSYAFANLPLPDNVSLFGKGGNARFLSYNSLGSQYGLSPITIRKVLQSAGRVQRIPGSDVEAVHVDDVEWLVDLITDLVRGQEAAELIGATPKLFDALEKKGLIKARLSKDSDTKLGRRYSRRELIDFREAVFARANTADTSKLRSIEDVSRILSVKFGDIFLLLIGDKLKTVGLKPSKVGLISLMLDRDDVLSATEQEDSTMPPDGWMSVDQLAERLCAHKNTVYALLRKGYIEPSVFRTQRNYPKQSATREAVAAFAASHVTLAECIKRTGLHQMKVMSILEAGGVSRLRDELREMFLPRDEAEAVLSPKN